MKVILTRWRDVVPVLLSGAQPEVAVEPPVARLWGGSAAAVEYPHPAIWGCCHVKGCKGHLRRPGDLYGGTAGMQIKNAQSWWHRAVRIEDTHDQILMLGHG